nr:unnamed protein product [Digitaria exilis]
MAQCQRLLVDLVLTAVLLVVAEAGGDPLDTTSGCRGLTRGRFSRVFAFGNSLTDTGNAAIFPLTAAQLRVTARSFFFVGEMGVNDYFLSLQNNRTVDETASLVPHVVGAIRSALVAMIAAGARTVVVTGMVPLGCAPYFLALFPGAPGDYDRVNGCNKRLNGLAELHNCELKRTLGELSRIHPGRSFVYGEVYRPIASAVASPAAYGFGNTTLAACCGGGGGPYNFSFATFCGTTASTTCADPSKSIAWDGIHFTEAANRLMATAILSGQ